jgi:uncharacterized protein YidB (DUF937 family)
MGLFEEVSQQFLSGSAGSAHPGMANAVLQMIASQPGGLPGLVQGFHDKGLGGIVSSWIGSGQNQPITAEQLQKVLSSDQIQHLAQKAGVSPTLAASTIASVLPQVVDKLTPNGSIEHSLLAGGLGLLGQLK